MIFNIKCFCTYLSTKKKQFKELWINSMHCSILHCMVYRHCVFVSNNLFITYTSNNSTRNHQKSQRKTTLINLNACADGNQCRIDILSRQQRQIDFRTVFLACASVTLYKNFAHLLRITAVKTYQNLNKFYTDRELL